MELTEKLEEVLNDLNNNPNIFASLVIRKDGLFLAFLSKVDYINKNIAVSLATIYNTFEQTSEELKTGQLSYLLIKAENKNIFFIEISKDIILVLFLNTASNINEIYSESNIISKKILEILS